VSAKQIAKLTDPLAAAEQFAVEEDRGQPVATDWSVVELDLNLW